MKYLPLLLILLVACGTEVEPEDVFEPYQVGSWMITSETNAEWVGVKAKFNSTESDTITFLSPTDNAINIEETGNREALITYTDSTYANQRVQVVYPPMQAIELSGFSTQVYDEYVDIEIPVGFDCNYQGWDNTSILQFDYSDPETLEVKQVFRFDVDGIHEALYQILCTTQQ